MNRRILPQDFTAGFHRKFSSPLPGTSLTLFMLYRYLGGVFAILVAVITWQLSAELLQGIQTPSSDNYYNKPYFLVWLMSGGYMIFLPMWLVLRIFSLHSREISISSIIQHPTMLFGSEEIWVSKLGIISSFPYFLCGYLWYLSIVHTSVTANTAIYDSGFIFIFFFSIFLLQEKVSLLKLMSVVVCFVGLMIIVYTGSQSEEDGVDQTIMGYIQVILATILCSFYDVIYKKYGTKPVKEKMDTPGELGSHLADPISIQEVGGEVVMQKENEKVTNTEDIPISSSFLFQGMVGLATVLLYWPGIIFLNWIGFEVFQWPDWDTSLVLGINMFIDSINAMSFLLAISWATPLFVGIGSLLNIPVSIFLDILIHYYSLPWLGYFGIFFIVLGFFLLVLADIVIKSSKMHKNLPSKIFAWSWRWRSQSSMNNPIN